MISPDGMPAKPPVAGLLSDTLAQATATSICTAEQKHLRRLSDVGYNDTYTGDVLAEYDDMASRTAALAADNARQYMAMQRACADLRTLAADALNVPPDEMQLMLRGIAATLKCSMMQVQVRSSDGLVQTDDEARDEATVKGTHVLQGV